MSSSQKIIILVLIAILLLVVGVWMFRPGQARLAGVPEDSLVSQIETASPDRLMDIVMELASRGESAIPTIMQAFEQAGERSDVQNALAESVYRMRASPQTVTALERMSELSDDGATADRIRGLAADHKMMAKRTPAR
jgi:hypothetical protein